MQIDPTTPASRSARSGGPLAGSFTGFFEGALAACLLLSPAGQAQEGPAQAGPAPAPAAQGATGETGDASSEFGEPLVVDGERVSDLELKRFLIYGPGSMMFEATKINIIIEDELEQRALFRTEDAMAVWVEDQGGEVDPEAYDQRYEELFQENLAAVTERFRVTDEEFQTERQFHIDQFEKNYPILDTDTEIARAYKSVETFEKQLRQTLHFDKVYLPLDPDEWPAITVEAIRADSGDILLDDYRQSYERRLEWAAENNGEMPREDSLYMQVLRQIVRDAVYNLIDIRTAADGIPEELVLWVDIDRDGEPEETVRTEELWQEVERDIGPKDVLDAKYWYATIRATQHRLERDGVLSSDEECQASWDEFAAQYSGTTFPVSQVATVTYQFPSAEAYKEYFCARSDFAKLLEQELQPGPGGELAQPLRKHLNYANHVMGLAQVDAEVMLVSAFDIPNYRWKEDGWEWAEERAEEILEAVHDNRDAYAEQRTDAAQAQAKGEAFESDVPVEEPHRFWTELMNANSEYWDPPQPEHERPGAEHGMTKKGRFGPKYRHDLQSKIGETPFEHFVYGESITDRVFFDVPVNEVGGPFRGPRGYYLVKVLRRTNPTRPLNLSNEKHLEILRDDYVRAAFVDYAREAREQADIQGLPEL